MLNDSFMIQRSSHTLRTDFITSDGTALLKFPITVCVSKAPPGLRYYTNARAIILRAFTLLWYSEPCCSNKNPKQTRLTTFLLDHLQKRETRETFPTAKTSYFESNVATVTVEN